jgi:fructose-1,6-bisphosphatase/inositol monophosphatase family enzyme
MENWLQIFREIGGEVQEVAQNISGKKEAKKYLGRGAGGDITRGIDKAVEDVILKKLRDVGDVRIISEESGEMEIGAPRGVIIIDPLDGSGNAKDGIPLYATSLAFAASEPKIGEVELGYVRNLATGDEYHAQKGQGSFLNNKRITTTKSENLSAVGLELHPHTQDTLMKAARVMDAANRTRCFGSVALDICFVAQGALSGYVDFRNVCRLLDISAVSLLVEEANGVITDDLGKSLNERIITVKSSSNLIIGGNSALHKQLLDII